MRLSLSMKVGLVSLFSCLVLLLSLLSSTSMASAHTANTLQSDHISSITVADPQCPPATVYTVRFVNGEAPKFDCADPSNDSSTNSGSAIYYHHDDK